MDGEAGPRLQICFIRSLGYIGEVVKGRGTTFWIS